MISGTSTAKKTRSMPLLGHLAELRRRLIICIGAVSIGAVIGFLMWNPVLDIATEPYCKAQLERGVEQIAGGSACQLYISNPVELLTTRLTVSGYLGLIFALPIVLWNVWRFVTPGLSRSEKRYAIPFVVSSIALFALGGTVAWLTFPQAMSFFLQVGGDHVLTLFNPSPYLKLIFLMILVFGIVFEFPLLLVFLQLAGAISSRQLRNWRRYAIVSNFGVAAVITPSGDPYSLVMLAIPMCIFYEAAILIGRLLKK